MSGRIIFQFIDIAHKFSYDSRPYDLDARSNLCGANLNRAYLVRAYLVRADLTATDLSRADLSEAILLGARFVGTDLAGADLTGCRIYGISAWGLKLDEHTKQQNLIITPYGEPEITVDNIEVAQFVYLLLHNEKIRDVIDTIGKKAVLILGRFTAERKNGPRCPTRGVAQARLSAHPVRLR